MSANEVETSSLQACSSVEVWIAVPGNGDASLAGSTIQARIFVVDWKMRCDGVSSGRAPALGKFAPVWCLPGHFEVSPK